MAPTFLLSFLAKFLDTDGYIVTPDFVLQRRFRLFEADHLLRIDSRVAVFDLAHLADSLGADYKLSGGKRVDVGVFAGFGVLSRHSTTPLAALH